MNSFALAAISLHFHLPTPLPAEVDLPLVVPLDPPIKPEILAELALEHHKRHYQVAAAVNVWPSSTVNDWETGYFTSLIMRFSCSILKRLQQKGEEC
jgi:hypothetical protein